MKYKIYPKQFRNERIAIEKNRCFFIMPFSDEFNYIYGQIKSALQKEGYICNRVDEISGPTPIMNKIIREMLKAQFVIADLTDCNPNVFYELGIVHTFKDAESIILIKRQDSKVPFDVTHLTYIAYDNSNHYLLTSELKKVLSEYKHIASFYEALNAQGIIDYVHDNQDEFVEILKHILGNNISFVTDILNHEHDFQSNQVEEIVSSFLNTFKKFLSEYDPTIIAGIFNFYSKLLLACNKYTFIQEYISQFITDFFINTNISESDILSYTTDLVLEFANRGKQLNIVMPWIVGYFKRSKSGTIDLNRYKLEAFLMRTSIIEINNIICNAVKDDNQHIREHFADIIGEKKLIQAQSNLCTQLVVEKNYFTATSIIDALGKLGDSSSCVQIKQWLDENETEIILTKQWFVLNHARIALGKLDVKYLEEFEAKYNQYFNEIM